MPKKRIFYLSLLLTAAMVAYYVLLSLYENNGRYIYPIDDTYIHMAMAKNFSLHHTWGVTPDGFTSSTSSPLYTFILSVCYFMFGVRDYFPLLLNIICGFFILYSLYVYAQKNLNAVTYLVCTILAILLTPLHIIILSGMEHSLHILLSFWLLILSAQVLNEPTHRKKTILLIIAALSVMTRYESIFFIFIIFLFLFYGRNYKYSFLFLTAGLAPLIIYGIISVMNGSLFIPNSILIKANLPEHSIKGIADFFYSNCFLLFSNPHLASCMYLLLLCMYISGKETTLILSLREHFLPFTVLVAIILHINFARMGWFFRYEGYLVFLSFIALPPLMDTLVSAINLHRAKQMTLAGFCAALLIPFFTRFIQSVYAGQKASNNIYEQQVQMAEFVKKYYPGGKIIANDIGAITYYNTIHLFDVNGLGTIEVIKNRKLKQGRLSEEAFIEEYSKKNKFQIAITYKDQSNGSLPAGWIPVGKWKLKDNRVCAGSTVNFYAADTAGYEQLKNNFAGFSKNLDDNTEVSY